MLCSTHVSKHCDLPAAGIYLDVYHEICTAFKPPREDVQHSSASVSFDKSASVADATAIVVDAFIREGEDKAAEWAASGFGLAAGACDGGPDVKAWIAHREGSNTGKPGFQASLVFYACPGYEHVYHLVAIGSSAGKSGVGTALLVEFLRQCLSGTRLGAVVLEALGSKVHYYEVFFAAVAKAKTTVQSMPGSLEMYLRRHGFPRGVGDDVWFEVASGNTLMVATSYKLSKMLSLAETVPQQVEPQVRHASEHDGSSQTDGTKCVVWVQAEAANLAKDGPALAARGFVGSVNGAVLFGTVVGKTATSHLRRSDGLLSVPSVKLSDLFIVSLGSGDGKFSIEGSAYVLGWTEVSYATSDEAVQLAISAACSRPASALPSGGLKRSIEDAATQAFALQRKKHETKRRQQQKASRLATQAHIDSVRVGAAAAEIYAGLNDVCGTSGGGHSPPEVEEIVKAIEPVLHSACLKGFGKERNVDAFHTVIDSARGSTADLKRFCDCLVDRYLFNMSGGLYDAAVKLQNELVNLKDSRPKRSKKKIVSATKQRYDDQLVLLRKARNDWHNAVGRSDIFGPTVFQNVRCRGRPWSWRSSKLDSHDTKCCDAVSYFTKQLWLPDNDNTYGMKLLTVIPHAVAADIWKLRSGQLPVKLNLPLHLYIGHKAALAVYSTVETTALEALGQSEVTRTARATDIIGGRTVRSLTDATGRITEEFVDIVHVPRHEYKQRAADEAFTLPVHGTVRDSVANRLSLQHIADILPKRQGIEDLKQGLSVQCFDNRVAQVIMSVWRRRYGTNAALQFPSVTETISQIACGSKEVDRPHVLLIAGAGVGKTYTGFAIDAARRAHKDYSGEQQIRLSSRNKAAQIMSDEHAKGRTITGGGTSGIVCPC